MSTKTTNKSFKDDTIGVVEYNGEKVEITISDIWFIDFIRKTQYGELSSVQIQDGKIIMVKKCEQKIKPIRG